jgi:23S rRNA (uracil1939-C5)-methyltransferase
VGRRHKQLPKFENVEILDIAAKGKAIAKIGEKIIFVTKTIPGDIVDIQINKKKKSYLEGGCKWQSLPYEEQLKYKHQQVIDNLERIAKVELPEITPILPSEKTQYYRNKLEFTFTHNRWFTDEEIKTKDEINDYKGLGFHIPLFWDKIVDIEHCYLQGGESNEIRLAVKKYAVENKLSFFNLRKQEGLLRNLIIRTSTTGELMTIVVFFYKDEVLINDLLKHISEKFPEITSLMYIVNSKGNDSIGDQDVHLFSGNDYIFEQMENLKFKIGPKSFYQTNSQQAYNLYKIAREYAQLTGNEIVYDLYTGTGTIAHFIAKQAKKVIGIEYVPEAIENAKVNSEINNINNAEFFAGDMKDILNNNFFAEHGQPNVIITDPPRAGMHKDVINTIINAHPERIVYVSCNPATQARDINLLEDYYKVVRVQPVDMFPQTYHVENIVLLEKK